MNYRIRELRMAKGWTQQTLAEKSKVTCGTISKAENGKSELRRTAASLIAKALGVKVSELKEDK